MTAAMSRGHTIVVGAGSAGCVVAGRLAQRHAVTLVEAGPDLVEGAVPAAIDGPNFLAALEEPGRTWPGLVATRAGGQPPRPYLRGRGLGGSSAVNAMVAMPGDAERYRRWGWDDADEALARVQLPVETPAPDELGVVDRALLAADAVAAPAPLTRRDGRRVSSAEAYVWPVRDRITVRTGAEVAHIVLDGRRAAGVRLADGSEIEGDRVVVACGAIHTPALLLRSGVDTPGVGAGLQDHPSAALTLALAQPGEPDGLVSGALSRHGDVQLLAVNHVGAADPGLGVLMAAVLTPHGRHGTVTVDGDGAPLVDFALLQDERDVVALAVAARLALRLLATSPFEEVTAEVYVDDAGTKGAALRDDDALLAWVRGSSGEYVHASGSCAIGTVLDDDGAVRGYDGLYVCDASAFPAIPDANLHLPTTMLAERLCARWIHDAA